MDERFWGKINVGDTHDCWLYTGTPSQKYGLYAIKVSTNNWKYVRAHRYAWEQYNGKIPGGLYVCHSCDVPRCCNPNHLWLGTNSANQLDAVRKFGFWREGHHPPLGEHHHSSKLTEEQVKEIRKRMENGESNTPLAKEYGVTQVAMSKIRLRKSWKHV